MSSYKRGDLVLYETASGRRRIGLIDSVRPSDYPPTMRVRPWVGGRMEFGGRSKQPISAIIRRARRPVREKIEAMRATPPLGLNS